MQLYRQFFTVFVATGPIRRVATVLHFKTAFTDGTALGTSNNTVLSFFPAVRSRQGSMAFPWIGDPRALYEIHEASVAHYAADGIPCEMDLRDPAAFLRSSSRDEIAKYAEVGYLRLDEPLRAIDTPGRGRSWGLQAHLAHQADPADAAASEGQGDPPRAGPGWADERSPRIRSAPLPR